VFDGYSRYLVHWEIHESMTEAEVESIQYPFWPEMFACVGGLVAKKALPTRCHFNNIARLLRQVNNRRKKRLTKRNLYGTLTHVG
jgi:hypothetical protein